MRHVISFLNGLKKSRYFPHKQKDSIAACVRWCKQSPPISNAYCAHKHIQAYNEMLLQSSLCSNTLFSTINLSLPLQNRIKSSGRGFCCISRLFVSKRHSITQFWSGVLRGPFNGCLNFKKQRRQKLLIVIFSAVKKIFSN